MKTKLIIDVDTGIDDAIALALACRSNQLDILGVTTVSGNVSLDMATENTVNVLSLLGVEIPVIPGANQPMARPPVHEHHVHGDNGLGGARLPASEKPLVDATVQADEWIAQSVQAHEGDITILLTGPMTNLAMALDRDPKLPEKVSSLVFMGGSAFDYGNITPVAEFNIFADPEAAKKVLNAGFPSVTMVGLDVTRKALLTPGHLNSLPESPLTAFLKDATAHYMMRYEERNGIKACAMHDPLAVGAVLWPELLGTVPYYVDVETNSDLCDGQTVVDVQQRLRKQPNVNVATTVQSDAFMKAMLHQFDGKEGSES
ncbi:nucleoside hydrolase [Aureibacillus halotolerans]|uniref:Purine nucleosidase n=1 Tax=Aureibacillus halotolerans TaxID=1508390 RepID=A0A4R6UAF0_9BACI|nr:nucleoside hydrolase [Aureibacillus halotolerans]TDQ42842.1 purine nucleosidase [Aureibacillus halotolerans]